MDLGRFHYAIDAIVSDWKTVEAAQHLQALINSLSNVSNNPGQPQYFQQYKEQLQITSEALSRSSLNEPELEIADAINSFKLAPYTGSKLFYRAKEAIEENQLSPHTAATALQKLLTDYQRKFETLTALNRSLGEIGADYDGILDGDAEIEITIPSAYGQKTLADLAREAKEWHRDIYTISEVFDPEHSEAKVRVISTGSWEFFLASTALVIYGFSKCLKGINVILADLIKARKLLEQLFASNAPKQVTEPYERHLQEKIATDLSALASSLVDEFYKVDDAGRREELKNALTQSLKRLSKKLSEGSKVSLRLTKPAPPTIADTENISDQERLAIEEAEKIEQLRLSTNHELQSTPQIEHDAAIVAALPAPENDL